MQKAHISDDASWLKAFMLYPDVSEYITSKHPGRDRGAKILQQREAIALLENGVEFLFTTLPERVESVFSYYETSGLFDTLPLSDSLMLKLLLWRHHELGESIVTGYGYMAVAIESAYGKRLSLTLVGKSFQRLHNRGLIHFRKGRPGGLPSRCDLVVPDDLTRPPSLGEGSSTAGQSIPAIMEGSGKDHFRAWKEIHITDDVIEALARYAAEATENTKIRYERYEEASKQKESAWLEGII
ncbi:hypothetical protein [Lentzea terrae]|uniref:hypothetical protein n=1 Tax=Lentzea terrae TaxID=2200761 RepID=UPI001300B9D8|nr:hypothetical protein [Lentzea terrae]